MKTNKICKNFFGHNKLILIVKFALKSNFLVSGSLDMTVQIWSRKSYKVIK